MVWKMQIRYQFHPEKTTQAVAHLLRSLGGETDKVKLMKLVYIADRTNFLRRGAPLTGDRQVAMPFGPVPSATLNLVNGDDWCDQDEEHCYFAIRDSKVCLRVDPGCGLLEAEEVALLDDILAEYGDLHTWALVEVTHEFPEYKEAYVAGSSRLIPYELILKHHGGEAGFRKNRAVIGRDMVRHLSCPFPASETDL